MKQATTLLLLILVTAGCNRSGSTSSGSSRAVVEVSGGVEVSEAKSQPAADDWANWRGPSNDGHVTEQNLRTSWGKGDYKWEAEVPGQGHSSPVIVGDQVVLATGVADKGTQGVVAFDRETGEQLWYKVLHTSDLITTSTVHPKATHANGTLASDGELYFVSFYHSDKVFATALDKQGEVVWQETLGDFSSVFGYAPSPVLHKSLVIFTADHRGGGYISALDSRSGKVAWRVKRGSKNSYSSPALFNIGGKEQMLISGGEVVVSYNPTTGEKNWETNCLASTTCGTVVVDGEVIFASGGFPKNETVALDGNGELLWKNKARIYEPSMLAYDGFLYAATDNGIAYCWDGKSGEEQWKKRLGGNFSSSPIVCNGKLYISGLDGTCRVIEANNEKYTELAKNKFEGGVYASPAASRNELFFRVAGKRDASDRLICIKAPAN